MPDQNILLPDSRWVGGFFPVSSAQALAVAADDLKQKFGGIEGLPTSLLYNRQGILRTKVIVFEYTDMWASTPLGGTVGADS